MSRIIRFRAWDKINKRMLAYVSPGTVTYFDDDKNAEAIDCDVMQFTGLLDKNGKDIYEGDIVETEVGRYNKDIGTVEFEDGCFVADGWFVEDNKTYANWSEVIGNIYENKDLLDKTKK